MKTRVCNKFRLELFRYKENLNTVVGSLYIVKPSENGTHYKRYYLCDTLENKSKIIPFGVYELDNNTVSPRFGKVPFYARVCEGRLPRLKNVPNRKGILLHCGNDFRDSSGCILLGRVSGCSPWRLINSKVEFELCYSELKKCETIKIIDEYHE